MAEITICVFSIIRFNEERDENSDENRFENRDIAISKFKTNGNKFFFLKDPPWFYMIWLNAILLRRDYKKLHYCIRTINGYFGYPFIMDMEIMNNTFFWTIWKNWYELYHETRVHTNVLLINQIYVITLDYIYNIFEIVKERINYF